ncbi:DUF3047 domain-containing protein [Marinobacter caseinilyticus]|uniref:DUF3047 domain-containing protein n=1 Tax=Marinobacter caseinilyticus TaxID=2692195 RepID=UPI0014076D3E|nr:DUF3047 domain-containing protein [Marinobacter caseinilyticus]
MLTPISWPTRSALVLLLVLAPFSHGWADTDGPVPQFSRIDTLHAGWEPLEFPNIGRHSQYELVRDDGVQVVKATTAQSASGLIARVTVDPREHPILQWRWKVSKIYNAGDARKKAGDDYPARIYVAFAFEPDKASFFERAKRQAIKALMGEALPGNALNYIWASKLPVESLVPNPFTDKTQMIAVNSGPAQVGQWVTVRRDIVADYTRAFGEAPPAIVGVGIMSDSDNTGESAMAWYGDVQLLPRASAEQ